MADEQSNLGPGESRGNQGSSVQVRKPEGELVPACPGLPESAAAAAAVEPSDESPTVISKTSPIQAGKPQVGGDWLSQGLKGRILAHFELIEAIGVGGMAAVIWARDQQLDRFVALKVLPPEMANDPENVRRFHQEARAAAKLDHENIARVFFCGEDQGLHFIAFEFVEGDNLRAILDKRGPLGVAEAVRYILLVAAGLEHAASRGVVHRDIKPSNIIITPTGRAKLVDMGLARSLEPHGDKALTQSGVTLGTFDYISPEQALEPREADARSDIYSLGCTFYHMLTGQAPVPEGTAAKKLHHHQHVDPVDPRQLNPDVPDDVAAVLARMMAKDPKDRYQQPVHLIQHLMQVAQKVGAAADVPEVLFVDAPLPNAPRKRPLATISLAVLGLGLILFLLSLVPSRPGLGSLGPPNHSANLDKKTPPRDPSELVKPNPEVPAEGPLRVKDQKDLERLGQYLAKTESTLLRVIVEIPELDVTELPLVFNGNELKLESGLENRATATILFRYQPGSEEARFRAGLRIEGGNVHCENLRFEVRSTVTPSIPVAAVGIGRSCKSALFTDCTFAQSKFPFQSLITLKPRPIPLASLALDNADPQGGDRPAVRASACVFETGQDAIALDGPGNVTLENCAFGPHNALVHLHGKYDGQESNLTLKNCSAHVVNGPAFRLDDDASCKLLLHYCMISTPPELPLNLGDNIALIRQTDSREPRVKFFDKQNCIHNQNLLWAWASPKLITEVDDFKDWVAKAGGVPGSAKEASSFLAAATNPWSYARPLQRKDESRFQVSDDILEVRNKDRDQPLGIQRFLREPMPPLKPMPETILAAQLQPNEKLVDPETPGNVPNVYKNFAEALVKAVPGDVILIKHARHNREVEINRAQLIKPQTDLTLKPYKGHHPILILAEAETPEPNAEMFRLYDGKLQLENLEVLLRPKSGFTSQTVVALHGNGQCTFKHCLFTLTEVDRIPLRVVTLEDPEKAMKMTTKTPRAPEVHFQDCFVRGEGDLIKVLVSRPLELIVENSLLDLRGSLLSVKGNPKELAKDFANIKLTHVSSFLTGPLVRLRAAPKGEGLIKTKVEAKDSLFVAVAGKPLVDLDGVDTDDNHLRVYVNWTGSRNAFSGFKSYLEQRPQETPLAPIRYDERSWRIFTMDEDSRFLPSKMVLVDLKIKSEPTVDLQNTGANLDSSQLPPLTPPRPNSTADEAEKRNPE